ncbi:ABC transporter substrate-binding protein [Acinetobacter lanii]|uniref:ABC transporter substrate-binding protein n=1 Tax=Acinetobacter lanii TaxID=2715163 RepID=UPI001D0E95E7|nr:ABC transporter substrate-binding protein [Acinetobacter lanii]
MDDEHFPDAYQFYIANPKFLSTHPTAVPKFIQATHEANTWIAQHPQEVLNFYSKTVGLDSDIAKKYLDKRPSDITVKPIDELVVKIQQAIADTFFQEKLMPRNVDIAKAVWK